MKDILGCVQYSTEQLEKNRKEFNVEGICNQKLHYMVNISDKIIEIMELINKGKYFTINKARQFGKSTTLFLLENELIIKGYVPISISFEGLNNEIFNNTELFISEFLNMIFENLEIIKCENLECINKNTNKIRTIPDLDRFITKICKKINKNIVLIIDEVDKNSNTELFLSFLGMLRNKYLSRNKQKDITFHSVILAGIYDVKNLKLKFQH